MDNNNTLATNLKNAREEANLTQEYVASQLHVSRQAISRWETGKGMPDITKLKELSLLYGISLDMLTQNAVSSNDARFKTESTIKTYFETILLVILMILSLNLPLIGILIPISIVIWMKISQKNYRFVFWLSIVCIIIEFYSLFVIINHYFFNFGASSVQPL